MEERGPVKQECSPDSTERWSAALAYVAILCWLPYFLHGDRPFPRYHAKQGILLFILEILCGLILLIFEATLGRIPFLGLVLMILLRLALFFPILGLAVLGFARALSSERLPLPWIGGFESNIPDPPTLASNRGKSDNGA